MESPETGKLVVLTGASGAGKTTLAKAVQASYLRYHVFSFDNLHQFGPLPAPVQGSRSSTRQPGGEWQQHLLRHAFGHIASRLKLGYSILFEGSLRIAFIREAADAANLQQTRILLVECDDELRNHRLTHLRQNPSLASDVTAAWARSLHEEALAFSCAILDSGNVPLARNVEEVVRCLEAC